MPLAATAATHSFRVSTKCRMGCRVDMCLAAASTVLDSAWRLEWCPPPNLAESMCGQEKAGLEEERQRQQASVMGVTTPG